MGAASSAGPECHAAILQCMLANSHHPMFANEMFNIRLTEAHVLETGYYGCEPRKAATDEEM